jgi:Ca2+-binding RTX toxin-like protein
MSEYNPGGAGQQVVNPINGTGASDVLYDTLLWDSIQAGAGNDFIVAAADHYVGTGLSATAADMFNGGEGTDTVSYALTGRLVPDSFGIYGLHAGVNVNLAAQVAYRLPGWASQPDGLISIENVDGSMYADTITGSDIANVLNGLSGHDLIHGGGGNDMVRGGEGNDTLHGDAGNDTVEGGNGNDRVSGNDGNDVLSGGDGNDSLWGGSGNDELQGGAGNDVLNGGSGTDTAVFVTSGAVQVNLGLKISAGALGNDTLESIENVTTGSGGDVIFGSTANNRLRSGSGNDFVDGGSGNDLIEGASGHDTLKGGSGQDTVKGGSGNDSIEGNDGADYLQGDSGNDSIFGGAQNDSVLGNNGNDTLRGGAGDDTVNGGAGADLVRWDAGDLGLDTVLGFVIGEDKLAFGPGFLAAGDWEDNLLVFNDSGSAMLAANTAEAGWQFIARFAGVNPIALETAIDQGTVFGVLGGVGGGGPGDLF